MFQKSISLFYPMYNELGHIEAITRKAVQVLSQLTDDFEVLIIDDGSSDGSENIADRLAQADHHIRVIHHQTNKGYGQTLRTGFANAVKTIVAYTDCDEPVDLNKLADALPYLATYDMVIGYRLNRWEGWRRFFYSTGYNRLVRWLFGVHVQDINFSFKLIRREHLQKFRLSATSVFIDGELLAEAVRNGLRIYQMPIIYQPRQYGTSNFNSWRAVTHTLEDVWAYWLQTRKYRSEAILPRSQER